LLFTYFCTLILEFTEGFGSGTPQQPHTLKATSEQSVGSPVFTTGENIFILSPLEAIVCRLADIQLQIIVIFYLVLLPHRRIHHQLGKRGQSRPRRRRYEDYANMSLASLGRPPWPGIFSTACGAAATATVTPREPPVPSQTPEAADLPDNTGTAML
jgi:hypothetical protein